MNNHTFVIALALGITARSIATELLKGKNIRSEMISAQELIDLQTELVSDAIAIVMLKDVGTDDLWKSYFEKQDLIDTLTY